MYSTVIIANNILLHTWTLLTDLKCSDHKKETLIMYQDEHVSYTTVVIILHYIMINQHIIHPKVSQRYVSIISQ